MKAERRVVLASSSPRRKEILSRLFPDLIVRPGRISDKREKEYFERCSTPCEAVEKLSFVKAQEGVSESRVFYPETIVGADTEVIVEDEVLGKPSSIEENIRMLEKVSGRWHSVITGVSLYDFPTGRSISWVSETKLKFKTLKNQEIDRYIREGGGLDKAGGYGVQECGDEFVEKMEGSYWNVVGFPLEDFLKIWKEWSR